MSSREDPTGRTRVDDPDLRRQLDRFNAQLNDEQPPPPAEVVFRPATPVRPPEKLYETPKWIAESEAVLAGEQKRSPGRPKGQLAVQHWEAISHLYVFGEPYESSDGNTYARYPSIGELASRFNVSKKVIRERRDREGWDERRERVKRKIDEAVEESIVSQHATRKFDAMASALESIDLLIEGFLSAVKSGHIAANNVNDLERLVRVRSFLVGGPDSRTEGTLTLGLEDLQARHEAAKKNRASPMRRLGEAGPRGEPILLPLSKPSIGDASNDS